MSAEAQKISIRPISSEDDVHIASIIRQVLTEFGANRAGFAFADTELDSLFANFQPPHAGYRIAEVNGKIVGGAGFGQLLGGDVGTIELKKMYLLPEARGLGLGKLLLSEIFALSKAQGYQSIYLETTASMEAAVRLYEEAGFRRLTGPLGASGHFGCEMHFLREL